MKENSDNLCTLLAFTFTSKQAICQGHADLAGKMARWVEAVAAKPENLSVTLEPTGVEGKTDYK